MLRLSSPSSFSKRTVSSSSSSSSSLATNSTVVTSRRSAPYFLVFKLIFCVLLGLRLRILHNNNHPWDYGQVLVGKANTRRSLQQQISLNNNDHATFQIGVNVNAKQGPKDDSTTGVADRRKKEKKKKTNMARPIARPRDTQRRGQPVRSVVDRIKRKQQKQRRKRIQAPPRPAYWEVADNLVVKRKDQNSYPAYRNARVLTSGSVSGSGIDTNTTSNATTTPTKRICRATCCVETVAISLDQDENKIINTMDAQDLADVFISYDWDYDQLHLKYHGQNFKKEMLPCLLPGTIFQIDNFSETLQYFWKMIRPHILVPYIIITSTTDRDSPLLVREDDLNDPLLLKWYGTNPISPLNNKVFTSNQNKFRPLPLGLSYQHPQEKHLLPYLQYTNFTNPFPTLKQQHRWDWSRFSFNFEKDVFIHFGRRRQHRQELWKQLCPNHKRGKGNTNITRHDPVSCNNETNKMPVQRIYKEMSQYRFGVSPPGLGWDCYRTYELLLLGVIPIVEKRSPWSDILFVGLPVIQVDRFDRATNRNTIKKAIKQYVTSDAFQNATFHSNKDGWNKLFLKYTRRQILTDAQRDLDILWKNGTEYYQAYRYSVLVDNNNNNRPVEDILCKNRGSCWVSSYESLLIDWRSNPMPGKTDEKQREWIRESKDKLNWK